MSANDSGEHNSSATDNGRPYSTHIEPPAQGGERYHRCEDCEREILVSLGGFDNLLHADDCRHAGGDGL